MKGFACEGAAFLNDVEVRLTRFEGVIVRYEDFHISAHIVEALKGEWSTEANRI